MFSAAVGSIFGPYLDRGEYKVAKLIDRKLVADSIQSRQILIKETTRENYAKLDSIKKDIEAGKVTFEAMVMHIVMIYYQKLRW